MTVGAAPEPFLHPMDREYADTLPEGERGTVVATVTRFRRPDSLRVGDELPELELLRLEDESAVALRSLVEGRPLALVFGSFT